MHFTTKESILVNGNLARPAVKLSVFQNGDEMRISYEPWETEIPDESGEFPPTYLISNEQYAAALSYRDFDDSFEIEELCLKDDVAYYQHAYQKARPGLFLIDRPLANSFIDLPNYKATKGGDGYRVVGAETIGSELGIELVKLNLERGNPTPHSPSNLNTIKCELVLDPQRFWSIVNFEEEAEGEREGHPIRFYVKIELDYPDGLLHHPKSRRKTTRVGRVGRPSGSHTEFISEMSNLESVPKKFASADYRLPAFGIVEPEKLKAKSGYGNQVFFTLVAALFASVLIYFFKFKKR